MSTSEEPTTTTPPAPTESWGKSRTLVRRGGKVLGYGLLLLVALLVSQGTTDPYSSFPIDPGFILAVALVGAGVLLLRGQEPVVADGVAAQPPRLRSPLGILTLSAAFCVCGLMILVGNLGAARVGIGQITAIGLAVTGLGLLVGAWWGRARLLILVGLLLLPIVVITGFIPFPLRGAVGGRSLTVMDSRDIEDSYEMLVGTMTLDLLGIKEFPARQEINFDVAAGRVTIYVPERLGVRVNGRIEWGNATIGRGREAGDRLHLENEVSGKPGEGVLEINFNGGIASLYIERISHREIYGPPRGANRQRSERKRAGVEERAGDSTRRDKPGRQQKENRDG